MVPVLLLLSWRSLVSKASAGKLFQIIDDGYPLRPLHTGATDRLSAKCPVWSLHFSDSGNDASCGLENARYAKVGARSA